MVIRKHQLSCCDFFLLRNLSNLRNKQGQTYGKNQRDSVEPYTVLKVPLANQNFLSQSAMITSGTFVCHLVYISVTLKRKGKSLSSLYAFLCSAEHKKD